MRRGLERYLQSSLGPVRVMAEHTRDHGQACVLEVEAIDGRRWIGKQHRRLEAWQRESRAYARWTASIGDAAPVLHSYDEAQQALVTSRVPDRPAEDAHSTATIHREAGRLLARFHRAGLERPYPDFAAISQRRVDELLGRAAGLLDAREIELVRAQAQALSQLPPPVAVPCHLDYSPRNWLVDDDRLYVIDFAGARRDVWIRDLRRLEFGIWSTRPALREAFLDGYGRTLTPEDELLLRLSGALSAVSRVVRGAERNLPKATADGRWVLARLMYRRTFGVRTTANLAKSWRATAAGFRRRGSGDEG